MLDMFSYILGLLRGKKELVITGSGYTFTDPRTDGNIVITETEVNE